MKKDRLVLGVGRNDSEHSVYEYSTVEGELRLLWICPIYRVWKHMLERCYSPKLHARFPSYIGCTVVAEWLSFSAFRAWMIDQDWEGRQLDKDILTPGNKVYSPDTCIFVDANLNSFLTDRGAACGQWPTGTHRPRSVGKFRARCQNPFSRSREHLGYFDDPAEAHEAWRSRKHQLACAYADQQTDPRIAAALRARYA